VTGSLFRHGRGKKSKSKDIMLQHHDARTPATVGPITAWPTTAETTATACLPAEASRRERSWMPVTEGPTTEEKLGTAWVPNNSMDKGM